MSAGGTEFFPGLFLPADRARWVDRMTAGVRACESILGIPFVKAHSGTKHRATTKDVPDLRQFFEQRLKTRGRWFSLFSGDGPRRTATGIENVDYYNVGGRVYFGDELFSVSLFTPRLADETAEKLLVALGDAMEIDWAQYTPDAAARRLRSAHWCAKIGANVIRHELVDRTDAESRLPVICESTYEGLEPHQPHHFGWLNYWSRPVCAAMGLGDDASALPGRSYATPRGALLFKLAERAPAERDDTFAETLRAAYERFPRVARRLTPSSEDRDR